MVSIRANDEVCYLYMGSPLDTLSHSSFSYDYNSPSDVDSLDAIQYKENASRVYQDDVPRHYGADDCLLQDHVRPPVIRVNAEIFDRLADVKRNEKNGHIVKTDETKLISAVNQAKTKIKLSDTNEDIVKVFRDMVKCFIADATNPTKRETLELNADCTMGRTPTVSLKFEGACDENCTTTLGNADDEVADEELLVAIRGCADDSSPIIVYHFEQLRRKMCPPNGFAHTDQEIRKRAAQVLNFRVQQRKA